MNQPTIDVTALAFSLLALGFAVAAYAHARWHGSKVAELADIAESHRDHLEGQDQIHDMNLTVLTNFDRRIQELEESREESRVLDRIARLN